MAVCAIIFWVDVLCVLWGIQRFVHFLAENLVKDKPDHDKTEQIRVRVLATKQLYEQLKSGRITHALTIIALHKFMTYRPLLHSMKNSIT